MLTKHLSCASSELKSLIFLSCYVTHFGSVAQSCPTLRSYGRQHARPPCPSLTPGAYSDSRPLSQWCHRTISSSVVPFSSHLQSFCCSVTSNPVRSHGLQHARIPCASLSLGVFSVSLLNPLSPPMHVHLSR